MTYEICASPEAARARAWPILGRLPANAHMAEIGVSSGRLAQMLLAERPDLVWSGVDPYETLMPDGAYIATGDPHAKATAADMAGLRAMACERLEPYQDRAELIIMPSPDAASSFLDNELDLVFLDGRHDEAGVSADLLAWWPKVKPGGWLGGDDWDAPKGCVFGVAQAVQAFGRLYEYELEGPTWWVRRIDRAL